MRILLGLIFLFMVTILGPIPSAEAGAGVIIESIKAHTDHSLPPLGSIEREEAQREARRDTAHMIEDIQEWWRQFLDRPYADEK